jgi:tRNA pseudouridine38-40 synthase
MAALTAALNDHLPADIGVQGCRQVDEEFHPRFDARRRHYRYRLLISQQPDPLRVRFVWRRWSEIDLAQMQRASDGFVGRYDFGAFGQAPIEDGHTVRQVFKARWQAIEDELHFDIEADAFLQHMVRRLVAGLVQVGEGRLGAAELLGYLNKPGQRWQGNLAPPPGLSLMQVKYDRD